MSKCAGDWESRQGWEAGHMCVVLWLPGCCQDETHVERERKREQHLSRAASSQCRICQQDGGLPMKLPAKIICRNKLPWEVVFSTPMPFWWSSWVSCELWCRQDSNALGAVFNFSKGNHSEGELLWGACWLPESYDNGPFWRAELHSPQLSQDLRQLPQLSRLVSWDSRHDPGELPGRQIRSLVMQSDMSSDSLQVIYS